ncbi:hypothetical protein PRIPAC_80097 [Pristionchus pacificus]|nr:hypothetical protein PRIPAC_80097 [Pristionchus pacificus]
MSPGYRFMSGLLYVLQISTSFPLAQHESMNTHSPSFPDYTFCTIAFAYPKGPRPYPIVGNLRQLKSETIHLEIRELSLKYGPIFTVFLPTPVVIITNYEGVREAYVTKGESLTGRPLIASDEEFSFGFNAGVINANGESWLENRRLTITILRDFGMGKRLMEQKVHLSITEYLRHLASIEDEDNVDLGWPTQLMISNIINETLFGFRYPYNDCQPLVDFAEAFAVLSESSLSNLIVRFSSYTHRFLQKIPQLKELTRKVHGENIHKMKSYIENNTDRAMESFDENGDDECFVHAYSRKIGSSPNLTKMQLYAVCLDVFAAGQEKGTTTLRWAMLLLAANQEIQERARDEIVRVVGVDRLPSTADKHLLPYTSAVVHEVQRRANIIQVNVNRRTTEDVEIMHLHNHGINLSSHPLWHHSHRRRLPDYGT